MKRKLITSLCVFAFFLLAISMLFIRPQNHTFADTTNVAKPETNNAIKPYDTNIPDAWYNADLNFGYTTDYQNTDFSYGVDFISTDGTTNYANVDLIELSIGESLEFYLEVGAKNYTESIFSSGINFLVYEDNTVFSLTITTTDELGEEIVIYDNQNYSGEPFTRELIKDENLLFPYTAQYNAQASAYENFEWNANYSLMKFTLTATEIGVGVLEAGFEIEMTEATKALFINVVDSNGNGRLNDSPIKVQASQTINSMQVTADYYTGDFTESIYLPCHNQFIFTCGSLFLGSADSSLFTNVSASINSLISSDSAVIARKPPQDYSIAFTSPGEYQLSLAIGYSVSCYDEIEGNNRFATFTQIKSITLNAYDTELNIEHNPKFLTEDSKLLAPTNYQLDLSVDSILPNSQFDVSYTLDDSTIANANEISFSSEGEHELQIVAVDLLATNWANAIADEYQSLGGAVADKQELIDSFLPNLSTGYALAIEPQETLIPDVSFDFTSQSISTDATEPNVIYIDTANSTALMATFLPQTLTIDNYQEINQRGTLSVTADSPNVYFDNGVVMFDDSSSVNSYNLSFTADYAQYGQKSSNYTVILRDSTIVFALNKSNVSLAPGQTDMVFVTQTSGSNIDDGDIELQVFSSNPEVAFASKSATTFNQVDVTALGIGNCTISVIVSCNDVTLHVATINVSVGFEQATTYTTLDYVGGNNVTAYLSNTSKTIPLSIETGTTYQSHQFGWISLDSAVATVISTGSSTATIKLVGEGTTQIIAHCTTSSGETIIANATLTVFEKEPTVEIAITKNNDTAFNQYDNISFSANVDGHTLSTDYVVTWYIDDKEVRSAYDLSGNSIELNSKTMSFYNTLSAGIHNIKVKITDNLYDVELIATKQISVSALSEQERALSFNKAELYLAYTASKNDIYSLEVLLDGVVSNEFDYKWTINNSNIANIMSNGASVSIEPLNEGKATLTVFTDIGVYEEKIISAKLDIYVETINSIAIEFENDYPKPDQDIVVNVFVNERGDFANLHLPISVSYLGENVEFVFENSKITVKNALSGEYTFNVGSGDLAQTYSIKVTAFNIKQFVVAVLPYLLLLAVVAIILFAVFVRNNNPYKNVAKTLKYLEKQIELSTNICQTASDKQIVLAEYKKILKLTNSLIKSFTYYFDEGHDAFKNPLISTLGLKKILDALVSTIDKNYKNASSVLESIKRTQLSELNTMFEEILTSLKVYEENLKQSKKADLEEIKQEKIIKKLEKSNNDALKLLKSQGLIAEDDD